MSTNNNAKSKLGMARIDAGLSQLELSEKSGVNIRQIQRYESLSSDTGNMTLRNAIAIAKAIGCSVEDLL